MKHCSTILLILLVFFFNAPFARAQSSGNVQEERETINRFFTIENYNGESMSEKALWKLVRENSDMLSGVSLNLGSGVIKLEMDPATDIRKVMKVFHDHQYELSFKDEQGVKKGYDAETGQIKTME